MHHIDTIILIGRPAAGKSEVIDFFKRKTPGELAEQFHMGPFEEMDDFPFVWECFEIDDIQTKYGKPRLFTDENYYWNDDYVWTLLLERLNLEFEKKLARDADFFKENTLVIEFSRGGKTGFRDAFNTLSENILKRAAVVYIKVPYEESVRKNRRRFKPELADSILYHSLPDDKMEFYYKENDWDELTGGQMDGFIEVRGHKLPFSVLDNMPEVTDSDEKLGPALSETMQRLYKRFQEK